MLFLYSFLLIVMAICFYDHFRSHLPVLIQLAMKVMKKLDD